MVQFDVLYFLGTAGVLILGGIAAWVSLNKQIENNKVTNEYIVKEVDSVKEKVDKIYSHLLKK